VSDTPDQDFTSQQLSTKELLWLGCRDKTCCHTTRVIVTGLDLWRISRNLMLAPWNFVVYAEAMPEAADAFQLKAGGPGYQVLLAKRGKVGPQGAPCIFLWKLADHHAQCGLGSLRPSICQAYPSVLIDDVLCVDSRACSCRRWSTQDVDIEAETQRLNAVLGEAQEYAEIVAEWNARLEPGASERTFREFCAAILDAYDHRYPQTA